MSTEQEEHDYTVLEAALKLRCSPGTIRNWIKEGKIRARHPGRAYLIPWSEIERLRSNLTS